MSLNMPLNLNIAADAQRRTEIPVQWDLETALLEQLKTMKEAGYEYRGRTVWLDPTHNEEILEPEDYGMFVLPYDDILVAFALEFFRPRDGQRTYLYCERDCFFLCPCPPAGRSFAPYPTDSVVARMDLGRGVIQGDALFDPYAVNCAVTLTDRDYPGALARRLLGQAGFRDPFGDREEPEEPEDDEEWLEPDDFVPADWQTESEEDDDDDGEWISPESWLEDIIETKPEAPQEAPEEFTREELLRMKELLRRKGMLG